MIVASFLYGIRRMLTILFAVAMFLGCSAVIVWPLWFLATERLMAFNLGLAGLVLAGLAYAISRAFRLSLRRRGPHRRAVVSGR